jgi:S-(hydroxymethyl)glutathione dehydrogenase/alcohol dehydrogenase
MTQAAVFNAVQEPLTIEEIDVAQPVDREVLVRTAASGVCHSDLHFIEGLYPMPNRAILGHEAAGVVEAVGPNVTEVEPGDHVIACLSVFCGQCDYCLTGRTHLCSNRPARTADQGPRLSQDGNMLTQFASIGSYAEQMLLHENGIVKIDKDFPFAQAALIGCGVTTGVGAALKTAKVTPGSTVAVFGAGGVGLSAIQGARIAGARKIIAVDMVEHKLQTARELGATDGVDASLGDPVDQIRELTDGQGVDFAFEAIGLKVAAEQAWQAIRAGGVATVIGMIPVGQNVEIPGNEFLREKTIQGSSMGSNSFKVDMPQYIEFYRQGRLKLDEMVTKTRPLSEINEAFADMKSGSVARSVIMFD